MKSHTLFCIERNIYARIDTYKRVYWKGKTNNYEGIV